MTEHPGFSSGVKPLKDIDSLNDPINISSSAGSRPISRHETAHLHTESSNQRRHSLPALSFLALRPWTGTSSAPSLAESECAATGSITRHETNAFRPTTSLTDWNSVRKARGPASESAVEPTHSIEQPVVVRSYSSAARARSQSRQRPPPRSRLAAMTQGRLPRPEDFSFDAIMRSIDAEVSGTLDAIADICANNRYSLSNQYEVHMPPHGRVEYSSRNMDHALVPVSEATSEGDSTSPTGSRRGRRQGLEVMGGAAAVSGDALGKLLSSSLAGQPVAHPAHKQERDPSGLQHHENRTSLAEPHSKISPSRLVDALDITNARSSPEKPPERRQYRARSLSAFVRSSSQAFNVTHDSSHSFSSPLTLISGLTPTTATGGTVEHGGSVAVSDTLLTGPAPHVVTRTQTAVKSGPVASTTPTLGSAPDSGPSGALQAVTLIQRDDQLNPPSNDFGSWFSWVGRTSKATSSHKRAQNALEDSNNSAQVLLRTLLDDRAHKRPWWDPRSPFSGKV